MNDFKIVQNARKISNFLFYDYLNLVFENFQELHGDRCFADDKSIIGGLAKLDNISVVVIGQQKGRTIKEKIKHNYGMPYPEGYRKALKLFQLAENFKLPIITFVDTPGAYPGINAEKRGQCMAIAKNLSSMSKLKTIIISLIIGEGCSGGALGISVCDKLLMLDQSYFATITPEGCASILLKTNNIIKLTNNMHITPNKLIKLKIIDKKINIKSLKKYEIKKLLQDTFKSYIRDLSKMTINKLLKKREQKLINFGML